MAIWFLALSVALVLLVFDSPALDYRLVMVGSILPWVDFVWGPPFVMHSVLFAVGVMAAVMVGGWGRRLVQRRWLGLAIGVFLHLVLAGTWTGRDIFWWPLFGFDVGSNEPAVAGTALAVLLEVIGFGVALWLWRRLDLASPGPRRRFMTTGRIERSALRA